MKRYESTVAEPRHVTVAEHAMGAACGLAAFAMLICAIAGTDLRVGWKIIAVAFVVPLALAGVGALVRVVEFAIPSMERRIGFDIDGDGVVGENIRIIPVHHTQSVSMSGSDSTIDAADLRYMIERLDYEEQTGWQVNSWLNERLPSGREIVSVGQGSVYDEFINILQRIGALTDRSERKKGTLRMSPQEILDKLRL